MKKVFLSIAILTLIVISTTSCNKENDCTCKIKVTENGTVTSETTETRKTDDKCDDLDSTTTNGDIVTEVDCDD